MRKLLTAVLMISLFSCPSVDAADEVNPWVVRTDEPVGDRTQQMWSVRWWQWAASLQGRESPIADLTGDKCGAGQTDEVFFLAGTYARHPVERTCKVPFGKHLFFPLVNYVVMPDGPGGSRCEGLVDSAHGYTDAPTKLVAQLDGKPVPDLQKHRLAPKGCFNISARSGGPVINAASNGYWLMLKPLPKGTHMLQIGGELPSLRQAITYTLLVQ